MSQHQIFKRSLQIFNAPAELASREADAWYRRRYHGRYRFARSLFAIDLALLGFILALAAFTAGAFLKRPQFIPPIRVTLSATPIAPRSGDLVELKFFYENTSRESQQNISLAFRLPPGFDLQDAAPAFYDRAHHQFSAGTLTPGARGEVVLRGIIVSEPGSIVPVTTIVAHTGEHGHRHVHPERATFQVRGSALEFAFDISETIILGQDTPFSMRYKNTSNGKLFGATVRPEITGEVPIVFSDPLWSRGRWQSPPLDSGAEETVPGAIRGDRVGRATISFLIFFSSPSGLIRQGTITREIRVVDPQISIASSFPDPGDLPFTPRTQNISTAILITNEGSEVLYEPAVALFFEPGSAQFVPDSALPDHLEPGGRIHGVVTLHYAPVDGPHGVTYRIEVSGNLGNAGPVTVRQIWQGPVRSVLDVAAQARYFTPEGEQIGRGPRQPRAGKSTTYWIALDVSAAPNPIRDAVITLNLANDVSWNGKFSASNPDARLSSSGDGRILTWKIDALAAGELVNLAFPVVITPETAPARPVPLITEIIAVARDALLSGEIVVQTANKIGGVTAE